MPRTRFALVPIVLLMFLMAGCAVATPTSTPALTPTPTLVPTLTPTRTLIPPTPTPAPARVWLDAAVPLAVRDPVTEALVDTYTVRAASAEMADLIVGLNLPVTLARWVYAVVAPFPTLADGVQWAEIGRFWVGEPGALADISAGGVLPTLFVSPETLGLLFGLLGPSGAQVPIEVAEPDELIDRAWAARPSAWAIVPFDELEPRWKVLRVDGMSVLDRILDMEHYPLAVSIGAAGAGAEALATSVLQDGELFTNRDTDQMTVLLMTGVTALTRNIAYRMEQKGVLYPADEIGPILQDADLTHISNEVSFTEDCPPPEPHTDSLTFCSSPRYLELLQHVGADVIELTGNHLKDYGSKPMTVTLELFREEGWPYFGGGENLQEARAPLLLDHNGNRLCFMGCNPVGPSYAWATEDRPGAAPCDMEYIRGEIGRLRSELDVPIFTWQYWEFYQYEPTPKQREDFRAMVDAGAVIVSGSQAHHPQAIEFYKGGFIHYGLGNLFFDQMQELGTRQEMADRHIIYNGRHISTELLTFMLEDYSQPRLMTAAERRDVLQAVFRASGW